MAKIRILPEVLSNQIAAGEVVQRPASVVKELVENSIDAGAARITVEIEHGGKSLIRIFDDGIGLSRDGALLSIERYATSKIFTKEDLFAISSFGFRGEALPSIASVSRFTLVSKISASDVGTRIEIAGGKLIKVSDEGAPVGTMVEVKNLFYNTPVRRKFLKGDRTENSHIADAVAGLALGSPNVGFRLFLNKKLVKNFPAGQDLFQRSLSVLGKDVVDRIYPLKGFESDISVTGVCSHPQVTRSTSGRIYLFVNNRLVHDRGLVAAVFKGYQGRIMKGRFPMGVVCVGLPFDKVDVNVHPSKREIKFLMPGAVYQAVGNCVGNALAGAQENMLSYAEAKIGDKPFYGTSPEQNSPFVTPAGETEPFSPGASLVERFERRQTDQVAQSMLNWGPSQEGIEGVARTRADKKNQPGVSSSCPAGAPGKKSGNGAGKNIGDNENSDSNSNSSSSKFYTGFNVLGQIMGTYIVAEKENTLVLIDQHAAHERVVYEALKQRHRGMGVQSQDLLVPETLDLNHREADCLTSILDDLSNIGLRIEPFGGNCFVIKAIPSLLEENDLKPLVLEIIETFMENHSLNGEFLDGCLISMACHRAVRANRPMNTLEMEKLIKELEACKNPLHCPHGRPTLVTFDSLQMEKLFKRVV